MSPYTSVCRQGGAEFIGGADSLPAQRGLRRFPAEFADGRCGEGDAFEHAHGAVGIESAGDDATFGFDLVLCRGWVSEVASEAGESGDEYYFCELRHFMTLNCELFSYVLRLLKVGS